MTEINVTITRKELIEMASAKALSSGVDINSMTLAGRKTGYTPPCDLPMQVLPVWLDEVETGDDPIAEGWSIDQLKVVFRLKEESNE